VLVALAAAAPAGAQAPAQPWDAEGDVAGVTDIVDPATGAPLGVVEYWQTRRGDRLTALRVARFRDGSSDEDFAEARVADGLEALRGRSVVRDADGVAVAEVHIDVPGQRIRGAWGRGTARREIDEPAPLPPRTYWGPLVFLLLKRAAGAGEERVAFRTVALTPRPRVFDLEILRGEVDTLERAGLPLDTVRFALAPTVHWAIDPIIQAFVPSSTFWIRPGDPPALVRYEGPRNYARRAIRIE
jgi:hypothetical protein